MSAETRAAAPRYYVYALADDGLPSRFVAGGRRLRAIDVAGVLVVVERVRDAPAATERTLRDQHAIVVSLARRVNALLPARFGALFTPAELDARVRTAHDVIVDALDRVRGRVQMTVRVLSPSGSGPVSSRPRSGTAYLMARAEGARALRRTAARIRRAASPLVVDQRVEPGKGEIQGTVYHLIQSGDVERYRAALARIAPAVAPALLTATGPWPPFAFAPELDRG